MNISIIVYILGSVLKIEGALLLLPALVGGLYHEGQALIYLYCAVGIFVVGQLMTLRKPKNNVFFAKEGFVSVALSWLFMSFFGCLPFVITGDIPSFINAFFETVSGFTTTGASVLSDVEALSRASLMWRSFTHWIGGMGVLVFLLSVVPMAGGATMHLMRAESPGPQVDKIVPKIRDTSAILYVIYTSITVLEMIVLAIGGMPVFDAVAMAFGSAGTGGFAVLNSGLETYSAFSQYTIATFVMFFGLNFNVYFLIIRRHFKQSLHMEEPRWYFGIIALAVAVITINTAGLFPTLEQAFRASYFNVASIITTTGYAVFDFNLYPELTRHILVLLMFSGACAGSTGGGIKVSRIVILLRSTKAELSRLVHPRAVRKARFESKTIDDEVLHSVYVYIVIYIFIFIASHIIISLNGFDFTTNFTSVLATLNNIGPGLGKIGPTGNYGDFSVLSKLVYCFDMLAGRLELLPMLVMLNPSIWRRRNGTKHS